MDPNHKNLAYGVDTEGLGIEVENMANLKALDRRIDDVKSKRDHCPIYPDRTPEEIEMVKDIYRVTMGNLRRAFYVVHEAERIAKVNGQYYP